MDADDDSLLGRLDSSDPERRHAAAYGLLTKGAKSLGTIKDLHARTPEARDTLKRLRAAIEKLEIVKKTTDYPKQSTEVRLGLRLATYLTVVPEHLLRKERVAYWTEKLDQDRLRIELGRGTDAEADVTRLELARVRRELGEVSDEEWLALQEELLPAAVKWVQSMRTRRDVSSARLRRLEEQLDRLSH